MRKIVRSGKHIIHRDGRTVGHADGNQCCVGAALTVGHGVGQNTRAEITAIRCEDHIRAVHAGGAVGLRDAHQRQRIAVRVGVVGQHRNGHGHAPGAGSRVIGRGRREVDDGDGDGGGGTATVAIGDGVGDRRSAVIGRGEGQVRAARIDAHDAASRDRVGDGQRVVVGVTVIAQRVNHLRDVVGATNSVIGRTRRAVGHTDSDEGGVGAALTVGHGVGQDAGAEITAIRCEDHIRAVHAGGAVGLRDAHQRQRIAVRVGVVGQHRNGHGHAPGTRSRVIGWRRREVAHRDGDGRGGTAAVAIIDSVGDGHCAVVGRREGQVRSAGVDVHNAADRDSVSDGQCIIVRIAVVSQRIDGLRDIVRAADRVVSGSWRAVGHADGDQRGVGATLTVGHGVG